MCVSEHKDDAIRAVFHSRLQRNFQKLLRCNLEQKLQSWLHDEPSKFSDGKAARIVRVFNFPAIFQKLLHCQRKTFHTQKFVRGKASAIIS